jgi:hypothetical protein
MYREAVERCHVPSEFRRDIGVECTSLELTLRIESLLELPLIEFGMEFPRIRISVKVSIGSVKPPKTIVVKITNMSVMDTYIPRCSFGIPCA